MKKRQWVVAFMVSVFFGLSLAACGGGGGGGAAGIGPEGTAAGSVTVQGQVSGTVFVAVDSDANLEAGRVAASGSPKSFSIALPTNRSYRFYLLENDDSATGGRVYPVYSGGSNVFHADEGANGRIIDMGVVDIDLSNGHALPAHDPAGTTGISHQGENHSIPPSMETAAFTTGDLEGTWDFHGLAASGSIGWMHGILGLDNNGSGQMTSRVRNGLPLGGRDNVAFVVPPSGIVGMQGDNTFHGVMSRDRDALFCNWTDNTDGANYLMVFRKRQGSFAQGDLYGAWRFHRFTAAGSGQASAWAYGALSIAAPGTATITSIRTSDNNAAEQGSSFPVSIDNNGILTSPGDNTFHGAMMPNKNVMTATATDDAGNYEFWMMVRTISGEIYSGRDLSGDWLFHGMTSGNAGAPPWEFGHMGVDDSGQAEFRRMEGPGGEFAGAPMAFGMDSSGKITADAGGMWGRHGEGMHHTYGETLFGTMDPAKDLAIMTWTDEAGGRRFRIHVK